MTCPRKHIWGAAELGLPPVPDVVPCGGALRAVPSRHLPHLPVWVMVQGARGLEREAAVWPCRLVLLWTAAPATSRAALQLLATWPGEWPSSSQQCLETLFWRGSNT